jgi:hypothetical protein
MPINNHTRRILFFISVVLFFMIFDFIADRYIIPDNYSPIYDLTGKQVSADSTLPLFQLVDSFLIAEQLNHQGLQLTLYQVWWEHPVYWMNISIQDRIGKKDMKKFQQKLTRAMTKYFGRAEFRGYIKTAGWGFLRYEKHSFGFDSNDIRKPDY